MQETAFPYGTSSAITVNKAGTYTIAIRHPAWTTEGYAVKVNGEDATGTTEAGTASYVNITRTWAVGDKIEVDYPMQLTYDTCPNYEDYVAFNYGPVLLAAQTTGSSTEDADYEELVGEYAGVGRMDHAPECIATQKNLTTAPMVLCERSELMNRLKVKDASRLLFEVDATREGSEWTTMELKPFYVIHNARYVVYWNQQTPEAYATSDLAQEEAAAEALEARTLDKVATGEQQSEAGHNVQSEDSGKGVASGEHYRDAGWNGWFEFDFALDETSEDLSLMLRFNINDRGRTGIISVNGEKLRTVTIPQQREGAEPFYNMEYPIPADMLKDNNGQRKTKLTIRVQGSGTTMAPGIYYMRLLKGYEGPQHYAFRATDWVTGDAGRVPQDKFAYDEAANTVSVTAQGKNNICLNLSASAFGAYSVGNSEQYLAVKGSGISAVGEDSYLWFLNGVNKGTSVEPDYRVLAADGDLIVVWDVTKTGLDDLMRDEDITLSGNVLFGLTSTTEDGTATLKDISFYSLGDLTSTYTELAFMQGGAYDTDNDTRLVLKGASGVTAQGAIKFHPHSFAFLEMATRTYPLDEYTGYELRFAAPIEGITDNAFSLNINGWDGYEADDARKYYLRNGDLTVSGRLSAPSKSGADLALGTLGITEIRNIWIQYAWGADDYVVELEEACLVKTDGTKEPLIYAPTHDALDVYAAHYTATADGQRICTVATLPVEGYKYLRIDLGSPAPEGWKVAYDGKVSEVKAGETTVCVPIETDYSVVGNLQIYAEGAAYPSAFNVSGMYLTNEGNGEVVGPVDDYVFPLTSDQLNCKIWPTGPEMEGENAGHWPGDIEPSFDEKTHTLVTGLYGFGGWYYGGGLDLSGYKYLVAELEEVQTCGASFRIYDVDTYWTEPCINDMGEKTLMVVDLHEMKKKDGEGEVSCDPSHIYYVGFWSYGGSPIRIKRVYATNEAPQEGTTPEPSELISLKYDGVELLEEGQTSFTVDALYDDSKLVTEAAEGTTVTTFYDSETAVLTITVKGADIETNPDNVHTYTVQFNKTGGDGIRTAGTSTGQKFDVYTLSGVKIRHNATDLKGLKNGMYIVNKKKVVVTGK